jgi:hypothetical protein
MNRQLLLWRITSRMYDKMESERRIGLLYADLYWRLRR